MTINDTDAVNVTAWFLDVITVNCDTDYFVDDVGNVTSFDVRCEANRTFTGVQECRRTGVHFTRVDTVHS